MSTPEVSAPEGANKTPRKPARQGLSIDWWALAGTALVAILVLLVNYISFRRYERWDLTRDSLFTVSERTSKLLTGLSKPVDIYIFMGNREPTFQDLRELVLLYKAKTDKLHVEFVDPNTERTKFRVLSEKYGVRTGVQEGSQLEQAELAVLVVSGDKRWSITRDDLVELDYDSLEGKEQDAKVNVKTEQALSGAIVQVTSGRATKVCVTEGHGEWTVDAGGERALLAVKEELQRENIQLEALPTRGKNELPKECDAVFVLSPVKAFSAEESAALKRYVDAGGNLLLALDPQISGEQVTSTGLEELAQAYGIGVSSAIAVELDERLQIPPSPVDAFVASDFSDHKVVKPLTAMRVPVLFAVARALTIGEGSRAQALIRSSEKAYGETSPAQLVAGDDFKAGEGDLTGPLTLAAISETRAPKEEGQKALPGGRVIVMGDSDWLSPQWLTQPQLANIDLLSSITGLLTEREALVAIAPRKISARSFMISEDGLISVLIRVLLLMPLAALVLGVGVWWQRRE